MSVFDLQASVACKLASIIVHAEEFLSSDGHIFDKVTLLQLIQDDEVQKWIEGMGSFAPLKRSKTGQVSRHLKKHKLAKERWNYRSDASD